ncbi:hypothetical protein TruAng_006616 [Truncatella angustata]|nr:hypothetical protein TruAng_006616 [Truncatella angustata]
MQSSKDSSQFHHVLPKITGITGYIGFKTLLLALEKGYRVRGAVRNSRNISELLSKSPFLRQGQEQGQLDFAVIPDFFNLESWVKELDSIRTVIHLASPLAIECDDYETGIIEPAISMVTTVLEAAARASTQGVTLVPFEWNMNPDTERIYTAADSNRNPTRPFGSAMEAYWASKALARKATRTFVDERKPGFDFINLLPSVVIGPDDRIQSDGGVAPLLKGTRAAVLAPALDASTNSSFPYPGAPVHVADVAKAHVDAIDADRIPGNSEFILSSDTPDGIEWDRDIKYVAQEFFPDEVVDGSLPMKGSLPTIRWRLDGQTTEVAFGWKFRSFMDTMHDLIVQYLHLKVNTPSL